jgi:hypothetical protein
MSKPPDEPLYYIEIAKECLDVAEGDVDRAMILFRQIRPEVDEELRQVMREALSRRARKKMELGVTYRSHLNLNQPALRAKLRARVAEILQENKPKAIRGACFEHYEGEIKLAGVVHSFSLIFDGHNVKLFVLAGSYDEFDALHDAIDAALEPDEPRGYYFDEVDLISPGQ